MSDWPWQPTLEKEPTTHWTTPEREEVWTKIDDEHGERNVAKLTRIGNLWYTDPDPTKGIYVYYTPTHWRVL